MKLYGAQRNGLENRGEIELGLISQEVKLCNFRELSSFVSSGPSKKVEQSKYGLITY